MEERWGHWCIGLGDISEVIAVGLTSGWVKYERALAADDDIWSLADLACPSGGDIKMEEMENGIWVGWNCGGLMLCHLCFNMTCGSTINAPNIWSNLYYEKT